jgi:hypothetical protein
MSLLDAISIWQKNPNYVFKILQDDGTIALVTLYNFSTSSAYFNEMKKLHSITKSETKKVLNTNTLQIYNIDLNNYTNEELIKETWIPDFNQSLQPIEGLIWFPFTKFFRFNKEEMFKNLQNLQNSKKEDFVSEEKYYLNSYTQLPNLSGGFIPPGPPGPPGKFKFRGKFTRILNDDSSYSKIDLLSDFFIENIRLQARRIEQPKSILESFKDPQFLDDLYTKIREYLSDVHGKSGQSHRLTPMILRDSFYHLKIQEVNIFKPIWAVRLLQIVFDFKPLKNLKWLDISAGWGDRLLTAIALDMEYLGFDPNTDLIPGHTKMIETFSSPVETGKPGKQRVIYLPFEPVTGGDPEGILPEEYYDVVLSSPPYFNLEIYNENQEGQSIKNYPTKDLWFNNFMFPSLQKAWKALKKGGYLILHIGDSQGQQIVICDPINNYIKNNLIGATYEGVIGLESARSSSGKSISRPVWVWKKR